jgi:hypothetical protein
LLVPRRSTGALALAAVGALLAGCSSAQAPDVEEVATTFSDPAGDPEQRCELLLPSVLAAFEEDQSMPCSEAIQELPLKAGAVESLEIWGGAAQVKLGGDTLFLTETSAGWRVTAAACTPQGEAPYDCEVEGP